MSPWVCDNEEWRLTPSRRRRAAQLAAVLLACLAVRVWLVRHTEVIARDGTLYVLLAQQWDRNPARTVTAYREHMGYPATIAGAHRVLVWFGLSPGREGWELAGQCVSAAASLAALAALWLFTGKTFGWRIAWMATLLFGVGKKWAADGSDVLTEALSLCLQLWGLVIALWTLELLRGRRKWAAVLAAAVGLCGGLGYLVRPEAILIVPAAIGLWFIDQLRHRHGWGRMLICSATAGIWALACAAPYMIAIGGFTRRNIFAEPATAQAAGAMLLAAANLAGEHQPLLELAKKFFEAMNPVLAVLACVDLSAYIGLRWMELRLPNAARRAYRSPRSDGALLMLLMTVLLLPLVVGHYATLGYLSHRYLLTLAALLAGTAVVGGMIVVEWLLWIPKRLWWRVTSNWLIYPGLAAIVVGMLTQTLSPLHAGKAGFQEVGRLVASRVERVDSIFSDSSWVLYYAGGHCDTVHYHIERRPDEASLLRVLQARGSHFALTEESLGNMAKAVRAMLRPPLFVEVARFPQTERTPNGAVRLYRTIVPFFQERDYLELNEDVRAAVARGAYSCGLEHYLAAVGEEGRRICRFYDEAYCRRHNPDVARAVQEGRYVSGLYPLVERGALEGPCTPDFDEEFYLRNNDDVREAVRAGQFRSGLEHFLLHGRAEGRRPRP